MYSGSMARPILTDFEKRVEKRVKAQKEKNYGQETPSSRDLAVMDEMEIEEERIAARAKAESARTRLAARLRAAMAESPRAGSEGRVACSVSLATSSMLIVDDLCRQWGMKRGKVFDRLIELFAQDQEENEDGEDQDEDGDEDSEKGNGWKRDPKYSGTPTGSEERSPSARRRRESLD